MLRAHFCNPCAAISLVLVAIISSSSLCAEELSTVAGKKFVVATKEPLGFRCGDRSYRLGIKAEQFQRDFGQAQRSSDASLDYGTDGLEVLCADGVVTGYRFYFQDTEPVPGRSFKAANVTTEEGLKPGSDYGEILSRYLTPLKTIDRDTLFFSFGIVTSQRLKVQSVTVMTPQSLEQAARSRGTIAGKRWNLGAFGLEINEPMGFRRQGGLYENDILRWEKPDMDRGGTTAVLLMRLTKANGPLAQYAAQLAKEMEGTLDPQPTTVDGAEAYVLHSNAPSKIPAVTTSAGRRNTSTTMLVTTQGRYHYTAALYEFEYTAAGDALDVLRRTWKWVPIKSPGKYLRYGEQSLELGRRSVAMSISWLMRTMPASPNRPNRMVMSLYDFARDARDFALTIEMLPADQATSFSVRCDQISRELTSVTKKSVTFTRRPGIPEIAATDYVDLGKGDMSVCRWVLINGKSNESILILFAIYAPTGSDRQAYEREIEEMLAKTSSPGQAGGSAQSREELSLPAISRSAQMMSNPISREPGFGMVGEH